MVKDCHRIIESVSSPKMRGGRHEVVLLLVLQLFVLNS